MGGIPWPHFDLRTKNVLMTRPPSLSFDSHSSRMLPCGTNWRDLAAVASALLNSEWKATTVLGGSIVEALLLWAIQQRATQEISSAASQAVQKQILKSTPHQDPERWHISEFIAVAKELNLIKPHTETQARLLQDFRNLIHPGKVVRTGQKCNAGTAHGAVAAVEFVIEDIRP